MRQIGHLDTDKDARTFCDFLYVHGIENEAERDGSRWAIWVHSDDHIAQSKQLLAEFQARPADPRFLAGSPAEKLREQERKEQEAYQKRVVPAKSLFPGLRGYGFGVITYGLICASVVVFFLSSMGNSFERVSSLFFSEYRSDLPEIKKGEIWRLVSPILLHFGPLHLLFNMMWLRDLGSMFEARLRSWYFAVFVIVIAAASNYGQFAVTKFPGFGGMSGVVYGLIGYIWIRGRFDPGAGLFLDRQNVMWALIWFALCFTGWLGPIANTAHAVGLVLGAIWGFIDAKAKWR